MTKRHQALLSVPTIQQIGYGDNEKSMKQYKQENIITGTPLSLKNLQQPIYAPISAKIYLTTRKQT